MKIQTDQLNYKKLLLLKPICTTILLIFFAVTTNATTWAPLYPYSQKTEAGKVKSHSYPYGVHDGGYGPGETFVYANGKLLYSIDKYFTTPFFTASNGQYLIEFDFYLYYRKSIPIIDEHGRVITEPRVYDGEAVTIYKNGELLKSINFRDLLIDTSKIVINENRNWFAWNYNANDQTESELKKKMNQHPAFIEDNNLCLITADNQLIRIEIATGRIIDRQNAFETLKLKSDWNPTTLKRNYKKVKYPYKFILPTLQNGKTLEQGLSELLNKRISDDDHSNETISIYFHTLLINKAGKCEIISISPSTRNIKLNEKYIVNPQLKIELENWINQQTFSTKTIPKGFNKFKYSGFVKLI